MLQNVSPEDLFSKFYSTLPAQYSNGAFIDGETTDVSDHPDLSPFLTHSGWVQATQGYSIPGLRAMSCAKAHRSSAPVMSMIKGLGRIYLSTISSTNNIEHKLLEGLTSWHSQYRPFQVLQHVELVTSYGHYCDRLVMMALRALDSGDIEDLQKKVLDGDSRAQSEEDVLADRQSFDVHQDCDEEDSLWPEDGSILETINDDDQDLEYFDLETLEDLAAYPIVLNSKQKRCAQELIQCCINKSPSQQCLSAYHSVLLSIFTTNTDSSSFGPLHSLIEGFVMSTSIDGRGQFLPPHLISPHLAKILYAALFSILTEVMKFPDPYLHRKFVDSMQHWIAPGERSPFCSVRRYSRMCYTICRGHISLPRLQLTDQYGPDFSFDGKLLSVTSMTKMYHTVYRDGAHPP
ncbi:hypothetical protein BDR03DRAFT_1017625 [Suillus americanus]|nr:hypothetical protein BDR03DRAFT_1017625 [Suillus americanus]